MYSQLVQSFALPLFLLPLSFFPLATAQVTVYGYEGAVAPPGVTTPASAYTGMMAYNPTTLVAPALPTPAPPTTFDIQVHKAVPNGVSIPINGSFMGFSIEFSILDQIIGWNSSVINVPFLNLMANIKERAGAVHIRVGGNTQESATLVDELPNNAILFKNNNDTDNPTKTPSTEFTEDLIYMMGNVSSLVNVFWYMGIPFNDTSNFRLGIAEKGEQILGGYLLGLQVGNEPDLYAKHGRRALDYSPANYTTEFGQMIAALKADPNILNPNLVVGPNLAGTWTPEMIWDTGFATDYATELAALGVERYPTDNCFARYGYGVYHDPQQKLPTYLTHTAAQNLLSSYLGSQSYAQSLGKKLIMFETNSASCGGFPGIADAFAASLWATDYALQLAYSNFSAAMFHVGGQNVSYNPFTSPPTAQKYYHQWTVGPVYYAALVVAEALGSTNTARVIDLFPDNAQELTPAYAIYENGQIARMALFNYMDDPTGASDYTATIFIGGSGTGEANGAPATVQVKYLQAGSVIQKGNITWAGQTFGGNFESDGRLQGQEVIQTVSCDVNGNSCQIKVPAPSVALVFLSTQILADSGEGAQQTFATTKVTATVNTIVVNTAAVETSNGNRGVIDWLGSTSPETKKVSSALTLAIPGVLATVGAVFGGIMIGREL